MSAQMNFVLNKNKKTIGTMQEEDDRDQLRQWRHVTSKNV